MTDTRTCKRGHTVKVGKKCWRCQYQLRKARSVQDPEFAERWRQSEKARKARQLERMKNERPEQFEIRKARLVAAQNERRRKARLAGDENQLRRNKEKMARRHAKARLAKIPLTPREQDAVQAIYDDAAKRNEKEGLSAGTRGDDIWVVDHIIPLDHPDCEHGPWNLQVIRLKENAKKAAWVPEARLAEVRAARRLWRPDDSLPARAHARKEDHD